MYGTIDNATVKSRPNITKANKNIQEGKGLSPLGSSYVVDLDYKKEWEFTQIIIKELQKENKKLRKALINLALKI